VNLGQKGYSEVLDDRGKIKFKEVISDKIKQGVEEYCKANYMVGDFEVITLF
jgi:hypothetical protein